MTTERRHRRHPTELKLRLVEAYLNGEGSLKSIAKAHDISHGTYYKAPDVERQQLREQSDEALRRAIEHVLDDWPTYGYRRVTHELRRRGIVANHKRVARAMRTAGMTAKRPRRFVPTIGSDISDSLRLAALEAACNSRSPQPGLIHHSDRGSQYASKAYRDRLELLGIRGSMSRKGNPYDNAKAESFMKTLKHEEVSKVDYEDPQDLQRRLPRFLEEIYNRRRLHSALGYLPPDEFEQLHSRRLVNS